MCVLRLQLTCGMSTNRDDCVHRAMRRRVNRKLACAPNCGPTTGNAGGGDCNLIYMIENALTQCAYSVASRLHN